MTPSPASTRPLTSSQSALIGAAAGTVEVLINQPTVSWKNALQQSRPLILTPTELYRGLIINAASIAPITAVQFGAHAAFLHALTDTPEKPSSGVNMTASALAGAASALVSSPAELVMIRQQRRQAGLLETARSSLLSTPYRGFWLAAGREAIFTAGYLGVAPIFADIVADAVSKDQGKPPAWARTTGSAIAGVLAGTLSHCFDTIKTAVQGAENGEPCTPFAATRHLMKQGAGIKALYSGLFPRALRITIGVVVLQECKFRFEPLVRTRFSSPTSSA